MDWLKCNICFNIYNETNLRPRSLICGHTFCEKCLNNTIQENKLTCPQCRKLHEICSAIELPINFIVEGLLKSLYPGSKELTEGAMSKEIVGESNTIDTGSETFDSLKSLLEQQEKSLFAQKEKLKKFAGICIEHPSKECMFRCSLHKSWVCEHCIEQQGEHPKYKCKITSFVEELENRRKEHMKSLNDDGKSYDETISTLDKHIVHLKNEKKHHSSLIDSLGKLVDIHRKEEDILDDEIKLFQYIIDKSVNLKHILLNIEETVINATTLDESNAAKNMVKQNKVDVLSWVNNSQKEVDDSKVKIEGFTSSALITKFSIEYREKCELLQKELYINDNKFDDIDKDYEKIKSRCMELTRNPICDILTSERLTALLTYCEMYVTHTHKDCQRWGRILSSDGYVLLQNFRQDSPPDGALVVNLSDIIKHLPKPRFVYLRFSSKFILYARIKCRDLGRVVFRVNEEAPIYAQQLIDLCLGQTGSSYYGCFDVRLRSQGTSKEQLYFPYYLDANNEYSDENIYPDLEKTKNIAQKKGLLVSESDNAGFRILTKSSSTNTWNGPALAEVVVGFPILEKIIVHTPARDGSNCVFPFVKVSESGLIIHSSSLK